MTVRYDTVVSYGNFQHLEFFKVHLTTWAFSVLLPSEPAPFMSADEHCNHCTAAAAP